MFGLRSYLHIDFIFELTFSLLEFLKIVWFELFNPLHKRFKKMNLLEIASQT